MTRNRTRNDRGKGKVNTLEQDTDVQETEHSLSDALFILSSSPQLMHRSNMLLCNGGLSFGYKTGEALSSAATCGLPRSYRP